MIKVSCLAVLAAVAAVSTAGAASAEVQVVSSSDGEDCRVERSLSERQALRRAEGRAAYAAARSSRRSDGASSSFVSARSSSRGSRATASASVKAGGRGRTVTAIQDDDGCTVVINERNSKGTAP